MLNRKELIASIADKTGSTKRDAEAFVAAFVETVKENDVQLIGFGTFKQVDKPARTARNPRTGETVEVPGKRVPYFKAGKEMRQRLNAD